MSFIVAIDGPAASGKGTIARAIAARFGFAHLDTGLLYRAVGMLHLGGEDPVQAARGLDPKVLDNPNLRTPDAAQSASRVAAIPEVRAALLDFQRAFAQRSGGAVLDGRDIGTVICPEAHVKLFVTASPEVRAQRRFKELAARDLATNLADVLEDVRARDARDTSRHTAPLVPAEDATVLETTDMTIEAAISTAVDIIEKRKMG